MKPKIHLITRADDAGSCRSANAAILESVEAGIIKNVSFMAVGPEIEHAVEILGGRDDICYGLHLCLNAEWERVKWKPLTRAPILTDKNGDFLAFPDDTKAQIKSVENGKWLDSSDAFYYDNHDLLNQPKFEILAQLQRLRELGLPISYVDEHMGFSWIGLRAEVENLCDRENLIDAHSFSFLPNIEPTNDALQDLETRIKRAMLDQYVWVTHPGKIAADMNLFALKEQEMGEIARERDAERRFLIDPRLPELLLKWKVKAARYDGI